MPPSDRPLHGRAVLVTRPEGAAGRLAELLRGAGATVEHRPTIEFAPPDDAGPIERALADLDAFRWIAFTSPTGVRRFAEALGRPPVRRVPGAVRLAAVGPGTRAALESAGFRVDLTAAVSDAGGLAQALIDRGAAGSRILLVRPEVSRPELAQRLVSAGAEVCDVAFYRTVVASAVPRIAADLIGGRYDAVVFGSPSGFRALVGADGPPDELARALRRTPLVCIGFTTAAAIRAAGFDCHPAETADDRGLYAALRDTLGSA